MDDSLFEVLATPNKSESDKKEYKVIKLKNELVACLISDPTRLPQDNNELPQGNENHVGEKENGIDEKKAAAMLCIGVGSFSNPKEIQGMAHFLEHMVFMGSEKYPTENDFGSFISKRGGSYNAFTKEERTCFYFDCLEKYLSEALDKFAQFFIGPLLNKEAMTREREAVDSEFQMALPSDWARQEQILLNIANPDSPVNSFAWGNLKTLKEDLNDDDLHEAVQQFRKKHYSAHRMVLAVQTRLPTESIQNLILECFSDVPNNSIPKDDFGMFVNEVYNTPQFNRIYYIKPIHEVIEVALNWQLPPLYDKYKTKSLKYLTFILDHEGKASLISYLKKKLWVTSAYAFNRDFSMFSMFYLNITLTKEGFNHIFEVIEAVFSYINLLRRAGPQEQIYEDIKIIEETAFRFATEEESSTNVLLLEDSMHIYPPQHFLTGSKLYYGFDPEEITTIIEQLVPNKVNILVTNKNLPDGLQFDKKETWFQTEYVDVSIPDDLRTKWEYVEPYEEMEITRPNPYITKVFTILPEEPNHPDYPQKLIDTDKCELWYRQDQKFKLPFANYTFYLLSPAFLESPKNSALTELFTSLISFCLTEEAYPAQVAKLSQYIWFFGKGITIKVEGFNEKLPILIEVILKYLTNLNDYITEKMFLALKENALRSEYNSTRSVQGLSYDNRYKLLIKNYWTSLEKYNALLELSYDDMQKFIENFTEEIYVKALVQGNVLPEVACDTVNSFVETLQYNPIPEVKYPQYVVAQVPIGEKCLHLESFNKNDSNSSIDNYYQVGPFSLRDSVTLDIIMLILEEPAFNNLRTKEQLGYSVYCGSCEVEGILGYIVDVQTQVHKYSTEHVDSRIEAFMKHSQEILEDTKEEDFRQIKEDYIKNKECVDTQLGDEVQKNWNEITEDYYIFDRVKQEVKIANEITLDEVKIWWYRHNHFGGQESYRKISFQIRGHIQEKENGNTTKEDTDNNKIDKDEQYGKPISLIYFGDNKENKRDDNPEYFIENIEEFTDKLNNYPRKPMKKDF